MPLEFLRRKRKRETRTNRTDRTNEGPKVRGVDRMVRRAEHRTLRQCAEYEEAHWPAPAKHHRVVD
jgi:hypothetical protein